MDLYREAKSQPTLPSIRKPARMDSANLRRTRSTSVTARDRSLAEPQGSRQQAWASHAPQSRPMSSVPSRPESRASRPSSRAASRLGSRPSSRMDSRLPGTLDEDREPHQPQQQRPRSGKVRPLSGRVFMRRTAEKGWVAKAYPVTHTSSQLDLDLYDDLSDVESLDSFFDDDFDLEQPEDKIQNLLSCNTLGVESKSRKKDWNSGQLAIPEFHCPRCRDHWYGLTTYPCDEELARLIREGLWYTGKGGAGKGGTNKRNSARSRNITSARREIGSLSSDSSTEASKKRGGKIDQDSNSRDPFSIGEDNMDPNKGKRKKRITFKLDSDSDQWREGGGWGGDDDQSRRKGTVGADGSASGGRSKTDGILAGKSSGGSTLLRDGNKDGDGGRGSGTGRSGENSGSLTDLKRSGRGGRRSDGKDGLDTSDGSGSWDARDSNRRHTKGSRDRQGHGVSLGEDGHGGNSTSISGRGRQGQGIGQTDGRQQSERLEGGGSRTGLGRGTGESTGSTGRGTGMEGTGSQSTLTSPGAGKTSHTTNGTDSKLNETATHGSRRGSYSQASKSGGRDGSGKGSQLGQEDHGKKVRKAVGYMRAVSPSGSEWGDPTHGRLYISSTATSSRAGSTSNLHNVQDEEDRKNVTLPPLIPPITNKKPLLMPMLDGFEFTRAWTFSYHNTGPITAKLRGN